MQEFINWLIEKRDIAKPSAKVYASRVKKVLSDLPEDFDEDVVRAYLLGHPTLRTAYRVYAEWAAEVKQVTLPEREVDIIRTWAQPDEGGLMLYPFIPKEPRSTEAADWKTLTPTLAARRRAQMLSEPS
jgi:hypothetical protein